MASPKVIIAQQSEGYAEVVIKDKDGKNMARIPNGRILTPGQESGDQTKVRFQLDGWVKAVNLGDTQSANAVCKAFQIRPPEAQTIPRIPSTHSVTSTRGPQAAEEAVVAKQGHGFAEIELKTDTGDVATKVPNGAILTVLGPETTKVRWNGEGWAKTSNLKESQRQANGVAELTKEVVAKQKDGYAVVVLKDESGKEVAQVPNGQRLMVFPESSAVKVRWKTVEGWAKLIDVVAPYCWSGCAAERWNKDCTGSLPLKTIPKRGESLSLATVSWFRSSDIWPTILEQHLVHREAELGTYIVDINGLTVTESQTLTVACTRSLSIGAEVKVLDIATVASRNEVCALIETPAGWVTKTNLEDSTEFIFKVKSPGPNMCSQEVNSVEGPIVALHISMHTDREEDANGQRGWEVEERDIDGIVSILGARFQRISDPTTNSLNAGVDQFVKCIQKGCRAVLVFVTSHGEGDDEIVTSDKGKIPLTDLYARFSHHQAQHLRDATKVFVVQCCRPDTDRSHATRPMEDPGDFVIINSASPGQLSCRGLMFKALLKVLHDQGINRDLQHILGDTKKIVKRESPYGQELHVALLGSPRVHFGKLIMESLKASFPPNPQDWTPEQQEFVIEAFCKVLSQKDGKVPEVLNVLPHVLAKISEEHAPQFFKYKGMKPVEVAGKLVAAEISRRKIAGSSEVDTRIVQRILQSTLLSALALLQPRSDPERAERATRTLDFPCDASAWVAVANGGNVNMLASAGIDTAKFCAVM